MAATETDTSPGVAGTPQPVDLRRLIPELGLREFWYPALRDKDVRKKPVYRKLLGDDVCFFRGKSGQVAGSRAGRCQSTRTARGSSTSTRRSPGAGSGGCTSSCTFGSSTTGW